MQVVSWRAMLRKGSSTFPGARLQYELMIVCPVCQTKQRVSSEYEGLELTRWSIGNEDVHKHQIERLCGSRHCTSCRVLSDVAPHDVGRLVSQVVGNFRGVDLERVLEQAEAIPQEKLQKTARDTVEPYTGYGLPDDFPSEGKTVVDWHGFAAVPA